MTTFSKRETEEAIAELQKILKPGDSIYTKVAHCSRSGMMRVVTTTIIQDNEPRNISRLVAKATRSSFNDRHYGITVPGCGFSAEFEVVHQLGYALYPNGFECAGKDCCRSNDHANEDRNYAPHWHQSGGYAFRQRSL